MKYNITYLKVPTFDLDWLSIPIDNNNDESVILLPGGGGSTKSGVKNQVQIMRDLTKCDKYTLEQSLETDNDISSSLCSGISTGEINSHSVICAILCKFCRLYEVTIDKDKKSFNFNQVGEFQADFADDAAVNCSIIIPSGMIITGGDDGICRIWEVDSSEKVWKITMDVELKGHTGPIMAMSLHSSLPILATASKDGSCKIWSLETEKILFNIPPIDGLGGLPAASPSNTPTKSSIECRGCAFSKSGASLLTIQSPRRGSTSLIMWNFEDAASAGNDNGVVSPVPIKVVVASKVPATKLAISESGDYIAVGASDGSVSIFSGANLRKISSKVLHDLPITGLKFSPVANIIASCSADNKCSIARISTYSSIFVLFFTLLSILVAILLLYISYSTFSIHFNSILKDKEL